MSRPPRIALLAARIDSGGVADHVTTLAHALTNKGAVVTMLARGENFVTATHHTCDATGIDSIALHFVVYGWARHGILRRRDIEALCAACSGRRVIVYLHELWIGASGNEPFKHRVIGALQRRGLLRLLAALQPAHVLTSNPVYETLLAREGVRSTVVPLPGNLPPPSESDRHEAHAWLTTAGIGGDNPPALAAVFGTIHPEWDSAPAVAAWRAHLATTGREGVVLTLGRHGPAGERRLTALRNAVPGLRIVCAGEQPAPLLAGLLANCAFGLATTPWALIGKSGTASAFLEAGLPVLVTRDDWQLRRGSTPPPAPHPRLRKWTSAAAFDWATFLASRTHPEFALARTADAWLQLLTSP